MSTHNRENRRRKQRRRQAQRMRILEWLADNAYGVFERHLAGNCCIPATRVVIRVLRRYGIEATPFVTEVIASSEDYIRCLMAFSEANPGKQPTPEDSANWDGWSVFIGEGPGDHLPDGRRAFGGHVIVKMGDTYLDCTLGAASRPERGLYMPPGWLFRCTDFTEPYIAQIDDELGVMFVTYQSSDKPIGGVEKWPGEDEAERELLAALQELELKRITKGVAA